MKFLSILAAASLALTPAIASAESHGTDTPTPGPLAGNVIADSAVPAGAIVLGILVLVGGAVVAVIGGNDSNNNTND